MKRTEKVTIGLTSIEKQAFQAYAGLQERTLSAAMRAAMLSELRRHRSTREWLERVLSERATSLRQMMGGPV